MKSVIAIRTHLFGDPERKLFKYLSSYFGRENVITAIQKSQKTPLVPDEYNPKLVGENTLEGLYLHPNWGWRCGDYWYYSMLSYISNYDYLWLIEPDVYFGNTDPAVYFEQFEKLRQDFISVGLGEANKNLPFFHTGKHLEGKTMSCLFGFTRIKVSVIEELYKERKRLSKSFMKIGDGSLNPVKEYPNDEIFVSTVLANKNLLLDRMQNLSSFDFRLFTQNGDNAMVYKQVENLAGCFLIHPVLTEENYIAKKKKALMRRLRTNQPISDWLTHIVRKQTNQPTKEKLRRELEQAYNKFLNNI